MKTLLTSHAEGNRRLILIFAGWGSDPRLYDHIVVSGWDTMVAWDYTDPSFPAEALDGYGTVYLYAWSMGVFAAGEALDGRRIASAFAVNGTPTPRHDREGIPEAVYDGTLQALSGAVAARSLHKFRLRMCGSKDTLARIAGELPEGETAPLAAELAAIAERQKESALSDGHRDEKRAIRWRRAYISENDRIFPAEAQRAAWERIGVGTAVMEGMPHYVDLGEIVSNTIQNKEAIGRRFTEALGTYERHADPQRAVAERLAEELSRLTISADPEILEIGSGTGLFTRLYMPLLRPRRATFVDLCRLRPYGLAPEEIYVRRDAEEFVADETAAARYDCVLSSSAIQWFSDLRLFFANVARTLRPGGVLACATFGPGNLSELDVLRPTPILYPDAGELREMLTVDFDDVKVSEEEIVMEFGSAREAVMHLKNTGVAGGGTHRSLHLTDLLRALSPRSGAPARLTYRPVYVTAVRKSLDKNFL